MTPRPLVLAFVAALAGCTLQLPFDAEWSLSLAGPRGVHCLELPMDLSDQALWAERDAVDDVQVEAIGLRVVTVGARNQAASAQLGFRYRPEGAPSSGESDLVMVERIALPVAEGSVVEVAAPPGMGEVVLEALRGSGRFTLVVESESDGPVDATVELALRGALSVGP